MAGIQTFLQSSFHILNRKGILKKCYCSCAILTVGTMALAFAAFPDEAHEEEKNFVLTEKVESSMSMAFSPKSFIVDMKEQGEERMLLGNNILWEDLRRKEEQAEIEAAQVESHAIETVAQENTERQIAISNQEYEILTRIVEAEAGDEDVKGRMLVANVILNRVAYPSFPNNIEDVVFQRSGGRYQFSPLKDGSYYEVEVQESTCLAVDRVLAGEDESMGALFFCCRKFSSKSNLKWFDSSLVKLFSYGCHEFFTYP